MRVLGRRALNSFTHPDIEFTQVIQTDQADAKSDPVKRNRHAHGCAESAILERQRDDDCHLSETA
jgi:hypothetical protein